MAGKNKMGRDDNLYFWTPMSESKKEENTQKRSKHVNLFLIFP